MDKKLIVANWKEHPETLAEAQEILESVNSYLDSVSEKDLFGLVFCPPFVFMEEVGKVLKMSHLEDRAFLGAQDVSVGSESAVTGEVSATMLVKLGVEYVIIGHSERRWKIGEPDEVVNSKLKTALKNELIPIVCIGEKTREGDFTSFLREQINKTFEGLNSDEIKKCIIAYEPVWAISTNPDGHPDTPESALDSLEVIRNTLIGNWKLSARSLNAGGEIVNLPKMLYGGSINPENIADFIKEDGIDGVLIGKASINKDKFIRILRIIDKNGNM